MEAGDALAAALKTLNREPSLSASVDQASAGIRDALDQLGVNLLDKREVQAALAGAILFHSMTGQQHETKMLSLALAIGNLL